ncbi:HSF-type DNA-binding-domain-containing protein [Sporodiniella umbellata]|nr:HSF-type DNA-binding-domain-containing protein [Sporodiniella umbellata]
MFVGSRMYPFFDVAICSYNGKVVYLYIFVCVIRRWISFWFLSNFGGVITVKTQSAFVNKLYRMLEDFSIKHLISWSEQGDTFSVPNPTRFSKLVLPQYFKHNNWQSFVRQLNMYGFHKVNDMIHTNPDNQTWEFKHPDFKKGAIDNLQHIKRKINTRNNYKSPTFILQPEDPFYKSMLFMEDRLSQVSRSYDNLKSEMDSLKALISMQQSTMIDFTRLFADVLQNKYPNVDQKELILSKVSQLQEMVSESILPFSNASDTECYRSRSSSVCTNASDNTDNTSSTLQKMGFGKESFLLNPE